MLPLNIKKGKGVKMKGEGGELKRVSRTWHEFKAQMLSSEKGKLKVLFGGIKKDYNKDEKKFTNRWRGDCGDCNCYHNHSSFRRHRAGGGSGIKQLSKTI